MDRIPVPGATRAHIVSIHYTRTFARRSERQLQALLNRKRSFEHLFDAAEKDTEGRITVTDAERTEYDSLKFDLHNAGVPMWANGVRVMKAGNLSHAVVATTNVGH